MKDKASSIMFNDILVKVLELSDNPSRFAEYLTQQIREIIGARTVVIATKTDEEQIKILNVFPERRTQWAKQPSVIQLADISLALSSVQVIGDKNGDSTSNNLLKELDIEKAIAIPLIAAKRNEGVILLFDVMDLFGIESVIDLLNQLSGVFALVIRNSILFQHMKSAVENRTQELTKRNEELLAQKQQLVVANEDYEELNEKLSETLSLANQSRQTLLSVLEDQTKARKALIESERRLNEAQRMAAIGNWMQDVQTNELIWSDEIFRIFEIDKENCGELSDVFVSSIHPDDIEAVVKAYNDALKTKKPYEITHRIVMADGRVKYVHEFCETDYDELGNPIKSLGTVQDITKQKKAEEELKGYRENLEKLIAERTNKLEQTNKELIQKNDELGRFNQLFVDREFRIKELRDELARLKK